jgi:hypothetical protein
MDAGKVRSRGVHWILGLVLATLLPASAGARSIRPPVAGNWEGKGTHGLSLSFQLARIGSRIRLQALAVTVPVGCPATVRDAVALVGTGAVYAGPHAAPPGLSHPLLSKPGTIGLSATTPQFPLFLEGPLVSPRRMTLTMSAPSGKNVACWPRTLRFITRPAARVAVADGRWSGTLAGANGVTGSVRLAVSGRGRAISSFRFDVRCPDNVSGAPNYAYGPDVNGQFIGANGTFSGPTAHSAAPGLQLSWQGRFTPNGVTGTIASLGDPCGLGGSQSATFSASHA